MAFIPVTKGIQVSLQFSQADGTFAENTFWCEATIEPDAADLTTLAGNFIFWWTHDPGTGSANGFMSSEASLVAVVARDMTTQTSPIVTDVSGLPVVGGDTTGTKPPMGVTFALTTRTGLPGRSQRGRTFMPQISSAFFANEALNQIDPTHAQHAVTAYNQLITDVNHTAPVSGNVFTLVVTSRFHNLAPRATGVMTPILSFGFHNLLSDFQRRRAPGHNRHH